MSNTTQDPRSIDERVEALLDQLESKNITRSEIETIERKIQILKSLQ